MHAHSQGCLKHHWEWLDCRALMQEEVSCMSKQTYIGRYGNKPALSYCIGVGPEGEAAAA